MFADDIWQKRLGEISTPKNISIPRPLILPSHPGGASVHRVPGLAWAAPLPSSMARQGGTTVPRGTQSCRNSGNTPPSHSLDHTLQECSHSYFLLLNAAGRGGGSSASALCSCNNPRIKALTQEQGQWVLGPPQPQGFKVPISHETILNSELLGEGEMQGMGRRKYLFPPLNYVDE